MGAGHSSSCLCLCGARSTQDDSSMSVSVGKGPGPSTTGPSTCSGILNSFMSRRSAGWEISGTDAKHRHVGCRLPVGQASDVVTLATARYIEFFTASAKNEEPPAGLDVQGVPDSLRSVRTGSEHCPSRGSRSSTVTGRASREASRLGTCPPGGPQSFCVTVPGPLRSSVTQPRGPNRRSRALETSSVALPNGSEPALQPEQQLTARNPAVPHGIPKLGKRGQTITNANRSRSDRISPSAAAFLLPAPSIRCIARAHTALPVVQAGGTELQSGPSITEAQAAARAPKSSSSTGMDGAPRSPPPPLLGRSSTLASGVTSLRHGGGGGGAGGRGGCASGQPAPRSRLYAESAASGGGGRSGPPESAHSATLWVVRPHGSATAGHGQGSGGGRGFRRNSIHFTPDGDVTVTGLPPTILSAGRVPRCLPAGRDSCAVSGSYASAGPSPSLCSMPRASSCARASFDVYCPGVSCGSAAASSALPAVVLASRSVDSAARADGAGGVGVGVSANDIAVTLNHVPSAASHAGSVTTPCQSEGLQGFAADLYPQGPRSPRTPAQPLDVEEQGEQRRRKSLAFSRQAAPNASPEGQSCNWGASSLYSRSEHSEALQVQPQHTATADTWCTSYNHVSATLERPRATKSPFAARPGQAGRSQGAAEEASVSAPNALPPQASGGLRGEQDSSRIHDQPSDTCGSDAFAGFSGQMHELRMLGSSLLATEAADVTTALCRLQEACVTAMNSELRSQRLAKRNSTELPPARWPLLTQGTSGTSNGPLVATACSGCSSGMELVERLVSTVGAACGSGGGAAADPPSGNRGHRRSASVQWAASAAGAPASATFTGPPLAVSEEAQGPVDRRRCSVDGPSAGPSDNDAERPSSAEALVVDGAVLEGMRLQLEVPQTSSTPAVDRTDSPKGDAEVEAYRARMLNVLLRGDFLHDTQSEGEGSPEEEDDDSVVEYRYGGFELGGGDMGCGFERRASFMEAVRRCSTLGSTSAAVAAAAAAAVGEGSAGVADAVRAAGVRGRPFGQERASNKSRLGPATLHA